jgi:catechol 2,3-dioxygenase-like lactoylglutathione lyase family enzyme
MKAQVAWVSLLVRDYDEALAYYTGVLGFRVIEDTPLTPTKRWVLVRPPGATGCSLLLAQARGRRQLAAVGRQSGGRVFLFLHTDDFRRDHRALRRRGVRFEEAPRRERYGTVAVFTDLYGNRWDLLEPAAAAKPSRRRGKSAQRSRPRRR